MTKNGGSAPSGINADWWQKILIFSSYGESSSNNCQVAAQLIRKVYQKN